MIVARKGLPDGDRFTAVVYRFPQVWQLTRWHKVIQLQLLQQQQIQLKNIYIFICNFKNHIHCISWNLSRGKSWVTFSQKKSDWTEFPSLVNFWPRLAWTFFHCWQQNLNYSVSVLSTGLHTARVHNHWGEGGGWWRLLPESRFKPDFSRDITVQELTNYLHPE